MISLLHCKLPKDAFVCWSLSRPCKMYDPHFVFPSIPKVSLPSKTWLTALMSFVDWKQSLHKLHGVSTKFLQWTHFPWLKVIACFWSGEQSSRAVLSYELLNHSFKLWFTSKYIGLAPKPWHYKFYTKKFTLRLGLDEKRWRD